MPNDRDGPTTKADCLNRLYRALMEDERRSGRQARMILLHDAEDMVDPAALALLDAALDEADFVQLPVLPEPAQDSRWVSAHYCEEFAEAHGKTLVVRDALGAALPAAGVGCAFARAMIGRMAQEPGRAGEPFSVESLTEDYELGIRVRRHGGRARFLRLRAEDGTLVATRACFPGRIGASVRQKSRWIHGIALQGWERLGWHWHPAELWMHLRDRRSPLTALVLACAYLLLALGLLHALAGNLGATPRMAWTPLAETLVLLNLAAFAWRALCRFGFTARDYGWGEGLRAVLRIPLANVITIAAGFRAMRGYLASFDGRPPTWDKTSHAAHPVLMGKGSFAR